MNQVAFWRLTIVFGILTVGPCIGPCMVVVVDSSLCFDSSLKQELVTYSLASSDILDYNKLMTCHLQHNVCNLLLVLETVFRFVNKRFHPF